MNCKPPKEISTVNNYPGKSGEGFVLFRGENKKLKKLGVLTNWFRFKDKRHNT